MAIVKQRNECHITKGTINSWEQFKAELAQSVERLTAEREVAGSIPEAGPILRVLKQLRNEGTSFAQQAARPSRGSDDHVKWRSRLQ